MLRKAVRVLGTRNDQRSAVAIAVKKWKADIAADLGGDLTRAQSTLLETAATTWLLVSSIDEWLKTQPTIVSTRKKALLAVVLQRQQLVDSLGRHLARLGLERKAKPVPSIQEYIAAHAAKAREREPSGPPSHGEEPQGEGQ